MIKVSRIAHLTLETSDFERQLAHYQHVIGLRPINRGGDSAHLVTKLGQLALILKAKPHTQCASIAFELAPDGDLADTKKELAAHDVATEIRTDVYPGIASLLAFRDPERTVIELFSNGAFHEHAPVDGVGPHKLGHVAFIVDDPKKMADFYSTVLGFRVSDWVADFFVFMRCNPDHHTVNFVQGEQTRMHHLAFELRDAAHLVESCEVLARNSSSILWGPVRHGPGHNMATYHRDAAGQIVELFTELDRISNEELGYFDPMPWHADRPQYPRTWPRNERRDIWGPQVPQNFL